MNHGERLTAAAIDKRAAAWLARIDAGPLSVPERREFETWLAQDLRHEGALIRLEAAASRLAADRAAARPATLIPFVASPPPTARTATTYPRHVNRRRFLAGAGTAASVITAAMIAKSWLGPAHHIETALGEVRRLPLTDGTVAAINTQTKISVNMRADARDVQIDRGEVWFEVAKDPKRPFTVAVGEVRVRALGTAFSVQRLDDGADVQVTEGVVEVWSVGNEGNRRRVSAGARTLASDTSGPAVPVEAASQIDRALAWREGNVALEGRSLGEAATEFNRYNAVKLEIEPDLRDEAIVGRFRLNEPEAFAKAAAVMLGARVTRRSDEIYLSRI